MFAVLGAGEALSRLIAFAGTAYVARRLGAESYGIIAVASAIVLYFTYIADFSAELIGARAVAADPGSVERIVPPVVTARLVLAAACVVVLSLAGALMTQPDGAVLAVTALSLLALAANTRFVFFGLAQPVPLAVVRIVDEIVALALIVLLARDAGHIAAVPLARLVGDGLAALALAFLLRRRGRRLALRRDGELVRTLGRQAAPLVAHSILGLVVFNSDLIFLRAITGAREAGLYAAAYTLVSFLLNIGVTYGNSLLPTFTRLLEDGPRLRALYDTSMAQSFTAALPIAAGGAVLAGRLIVAVFGPGYHASVLPLQILIWSVVAAAVRTVVTFSLIANHRQAFVLRITAWAAAGNLVLNFLLIPRYGMLGAAAATVTTELLRAVVALVYARQHGMPFGLVRRSWRALLATAAMVAVLLQLPAATAVIALVAGVAVYAAVLALTGGLKLEHGRPVLAV